jgi:hypothetical protein
MTIRREEFGEESGASEYVFRFSDGSERSVRVRVGRSYQTGEHEWACPVEIAGFESRYADIRGDDSLQALVLAISLAWLRIRDFVEKGGVVLDGQGNTCSLDDLRRILGR